MQRCTRQACLTLLLLFGLSAAARAEVTNCTEILSLPYTVSTPGIYCLRTSLSFPNSWGIVIRIDVDDVVLDLNGHVLESTYVGNSAANGVYASNRGTSPCATARSAGSATACISAA